MADMAQKRYVPIIRRRLATFFLWLAHKTDHDYLLSLMHKLDEKLITQMKEDEVNE
jgi:hypothetical protein